MTALASASATPGWFTPDDCRLDDFRAVVETDHRPRRLPLRRRGAGGRPRLRAPGSRARHHRGGRRDVQAELARALMDGPGIVVFDRAFPDPDVVDRALGRVRGADRRAEGRGRGRRRPLRRARAATTGCGARWRSSPSPTPRPSSTTTPTTSSRSSRCLAGPRLPGHQPGQRGQPRRRGADRPPRLPPRLHVRGASPRLPGARAPLSPALTLQGAVAHCDMPVETGPTMYLPHSQKYALATWPADRPSSRSTSTSTTCSSRCAKGDAAFFNPALFHGAGTNRTTDVRRMANLLQVSSAFGRAMETVDRAACRALYPRCSPAGRRRRRARPAQRRRRRPPRATRSPPTSTATSRSAAWPRDPGRPRAAGPRRGDGRRGARLRLRARPRPERHTGGAGVSRLAACRGEGLGRRSRACTGSPGTPSPPRRRCSRPREPRHPGVVDLPVPGSHRPGRRPPGSRRPAAAPPAELDEVPLADLGVVEVEVEPQVRRADGLHQRDRVGRPRERRARVVDGGVQVLDQR